VLAGQHAVAALTFPGISLYAGSACALVAMVALVMVRPQVLGLEARSALARLIPGGVGARLAPAGAVGADSGGHA
nr:hypothetical protein [Ramlibacter sp.]